MDAFDPLPEDAVASRVARALRLARSRHRLSQRELAELLGVDRGSVGRWETGEVPATLSRLDALLRTLGFALSVVALRPDEWVGVDPGDGPVVDRARRLFPAHLEPALGADFLNEWVRYRGRPNPWAPNWTFRMDPERRREVRAMLAGRASGGTRVPDEHAGAEAAVGEAAVGEAVAGEAAVGEAADRAAPPAADAS